MGVTATAAVGIAFVLDLLFEEFPGAVHPVALYGRLIGRVDRSWPVPRLVSVAIGVCFPLAVAGLGWALTHRLTGLSPSLATIFAGCVLFSTTSLRMLLAVAQDVIDLAEDDPEQARASIAALVGRETTDFSPGQLRSAAVESAAENLADGLVAPLAAFALGTQVSLAVGVAGAIWIKAINTQDSMLGYRTKPIGWASARLDDVVMWLPARLSAGVIALAGRDPGALLRAREWFDAPPSPNSGWPMATLAAVLDVQLVKPGVYVLNPTAPLPSHTDARAGVRVVGLAGVFSFVLTGVSAWF